MRKHLYLSAANTDETLLELSSFITLRRLYDDIIEIVERWFSSSFRFVFQWTTVKLFKRFYTRRDVILYI